MGEASFDFLKRFRTIHQPDRRDLARRAAADEVEIRSGWKICVGEAAAPAVRCAAGDLADYLRVSMGLQVEVAETGTAGGVIAFEETPLDGDAWEVEAAEDSITLRGSAAALSAAAVRVEDEMNFAAAPVVKRGVRQRRMLAVLRSTHSGCGVDDYPDWQLNAIRHAGFNAIEVFVTGVDTVRRKAPCDLNDLIGRAEKFGLKTIFYNLIPGYKYPDDPDAEEFFDRTYGDVLRHYPKVRAIGFVGESLEFPSRDPHTTGRGRKMSAPDGITDPRPSPGWYPCFDYPKYLEKIEQAIHRANPDVEMFFSTYNWGYIDAPARLEFIAKLPPRISLWVPWELFKKHRHGDAATPVMDYSISAVEPGEFFTSEVEAAFERHIPMRAFTNFAGNSWDIGCVPYIPVPQRWARRMLIAQKYLREGKVHSLYESHHYGWFPSVVCDLGKALLETPELPADGIDAFLRRVAVRDCGESSAGHAIAAWQAWSDAMDFYVSSNEDQYGPWRVGPAYPFWSKLHFTITMTPRKYPFLGGTGIIKCDYEPCENKGQSPGSLRYPAELADLGRMLELWNRGLKQAESAVTAGGEAIGVEPFFFVEQVLQYEGLTQLIVTRDMSERKAKMIELGDAFIALLETRSISRITVKALAEEAGINRKTFYNYYAGVHAVLDEIENEVIGTLEDALGGIDFREAMNHPNLVFEKLTAIINTDLDFYGHLLSMQSNVSLVTKTVKLLKQKTRQAMLSQLPVKEEAIDVLLDYTFSGMLTVYQQWFNSDRSQSIEEISEVLSVLCFNGLNGVLASPADCGTA